MSRINGADNTNHGTLNSVSTHDLDKAKSAYPFSTALATAFVNIAPAPSSIVAGKLPVPPASDVHAEMNNRPSLVPLQGQQKGNDDVHEKALKMRIYRQQLIASNIANADTPGYKAVDIDVQKALLANEPHKPVALDLATTAPGHISGEANAFPAGVPLQYHVPRQPGIDGNTVEMDVERTKFMENALMLQFALDRVGGHFKEALSLLKILK